MGTVTDAYLAGFEAGYDLAVDLVRGQAAAADFAQAMDEMHRVAERAPSCFAEFREAFLAQEATERAVERIAQLSGDVKFSFVAESHRCDSGAVRDGQHGAGECDNRNSDVLRRFSGDEREA